MRVAIGSAADMAEFKRRLHEALSHYRIANAVNRIRYRKRKRTHGIVLQRALYAHSGYGRGSFE